jgi:hypothetical protein
MNSAATNQLNDFSKDSFKVISNGTKTAEQLQDIRNVVKKHMLNTGIKGAVCTEDVANQLRQRITKHIIGIAKEYGFDIPAIDVVASYSEVRFNIVASTVGISGLDCFHSAYLEKCQNFGFKPEWLGVSFVYEGVLYMVDGLDDSRDDPFIRLIKIVNGKTSRIKLPIKNGNNVKIGDAIASYKKAMAISFKSK